ncbi:T9SS type A sorting domain-containing protein, partial [bacterium]|nr:T9SS type A sorting domain-containing protein [bacterium]
NPFNPETRIKYQIPLHTRVTIKIFNLLGQEIITLIDKEQSSGAYELIWDGRNSLGTKVSSGIYIYQMKTKDFVKFKKMALIK